MQLSLSTSFITHEITSFDFVMPLLPAIGHLPLLMVYLTRRIVHVQINYHNCGGGGLTSAYVMGVNVDAF